MERVVDYIRNHGSIEEPVHNKEIASHLRISEVSIRQKINAARSKGIPICSCDKGYYYSENKSEILATIQSLMNRTMAVERAVSGLLTVVRSELEEERCLTQ